MKSYLKILMLTGVVTLAGCREGAVSPQDHELQQQAFQRQLVEEVFNNAINLINDVEHSDSTDLLDNVVINLNQWIESQRAPDDWQVDPLAATLPDDLKKIAVYPALDKSGFRRIDAFWLQEAIWLRQAARHVSGKLNDPLAQAEALFDWTVRQIDLVSETPMPQAAWETMLLGRGTVVDRLWVFSLLARQRGLDVVMLATEKDGRTTPWAAALLHNKQLYLFEPELGTPLRIKSGALATLDDAVTKPEVFDGLKVGETPYRVTADDLKHVVALVEASPLYLSQRFRQIELRLVGDQRLVLSVDATAVADDLRKVKHVSDARLWVLPWERAKSELTPSPAELKARGDAIRPFRIRPAHLWKGRVMHLVGQLTGEPSASFHYQHCRPSDADVASVKELAPAQLALISTIKQDATYWLGLMALERGNATTAIEHLEQRLLKPHSETEWRSGAYYLIGRAHESQGNKAAAVAAYKAVTGAGQPQALLRAKRLE